MSFYTSYQKETYIRSFSDKLLRRAVFIGSIISLFGCILNYLFALSTITTWLAFIGFSFYIVIYFFIRHYNTRKIFYWLTTVFTVLFLNELWLFNNRSEGPLLYFLIVFYLFILLLSERANIKLVSIIAFLNLVILFGIDYILPMTTMQYPNKLSLLFDNYMGVFFAAFMILAMVSILKNYYFRELVHAQESDRLKSSFLANLSHEIRTPLNAVIGFSSLIAENETIEQREEFSQLVRENGHQLANLVDQLIVLSKLESGNLPIKVKQQNLESLFKQLYEEFHPMMQEKQLNFNYLLRGQDIIYTDVNLLTMVLKELLNNALKYSKRGEIRIGVVGRKGQFKFFVKDHGIGIREENIQKIFDRFVKIEEYRSHLIRGTGIGLSLAKIAIDKMGGELMVKSTYKKGTTFYFTIPNLKK